MNRLMVVGVSLVLAAIGDGYPRLAQDVPQKPDLRRHDESPTTQSQCLAPTLMEDVRSELPETMKPLEHSLQTIGTFYPPVAVTADPWSFVIQSVVHSLNSVQSVAPAVVVLKPARVFDGNSAKLHDDWLVIVRGDKIDSAGPSNSVKVPS